MAADVVDLGLGQDDVPRGRSKSYYLIISAGLGSILALICIMIFATASIVFTVEGLTPEFSRGLIFRLAVLILALGGLIWVWRRIKRAVAALDRMRA